MPPSPASIDTDYCSPSPSVGSVRMAQVTRVPVTHMPTGAVERKSIDTSRANETSAADVEESKVVIGSQAADRTPLKTLRNEEAVAQPLRRQPSLKRGSENRTVTASVPGVKAHRRAASTASMSSASSVRGNTLYRDAVNLTDTEFDPSLRPEVDAAMRLRSLLGASDG